VIIPILLLPPAEPLILSPILRYFSSYGSDKYSVG
jgi:hypothetical protein